MEVLDMKPIKNKKITSFLIEKSKKYSDIDKRECLSKFLADKDIKFISIDTEQENKNELLRSLKSRLFTELKGPYYPLDVPEYAKNAILMEINEREEQMSELLDEYLRMSNTETIKGQNLKSWIYVLEEEIREKKQNYIMKVRPQWIVKKILDIIKIIKSREVAFVHLAERDTLEEMVQIMNEVNIEVILLEKSEEIVAFNIITTQEEMENWKY